MSFELSPHHEEFRKDAMARIAAWAISNPQQSPNLNEIFAKEIDKIVQGLFDERRKTLTEVLQDTLALLGDAEPLSEARREAAEATVAQLVERFGYRPESAEEAIRAYLREQAD